MANTRRRMLSLMDRTAFERYRCHHKRVSRATFNGAIALAVLVGLVVADAWNYPAGVGVGVVLFLLGLELHQRWSKARWLKRFPELSGSGVKWRRS